MQHAENAIFCNPVMLEKVDAVAQKYHLSRAQVVETALAQYLEKEADTQQYIAQTKASWEHYTQTGLHVTEEEVISWMKTWGQNQEPEIPQCHL